MAEYRRVAYILKTRNLEGSVVAQGADKLPFLLHEGLQVHFVPPALNAPRQAKVASLRQLNSECWEVAFHGVEGIDAAEKICGCYCLAEAGDLPQPEDANSPELLLGLRLQDERFGDLGEIEEVLLGSAQATLVAQGAQGEVMVPLVDEFVAGIDPEAGLLLTRIPQGLLGLNAAGQGD